MKKFTHKRQRKWIIIAGWVIFWQLLAMAVDNEILLATPLGTAGRLASLLGEGSFFLTVGKSLLRIALGFTAGVLTAVLLAAGSRRFPLLEEALSPVMALWKAVPVASFVVILLVWWGSSVLAVAVCFLVVLPNLYVNTLEGLKSADSRMLEMARVFRIPFWNRLFYIYGPALRPFVYSGMKISLGMCWKSGVAAEVIGMPDFSIGERIYLAKVYLDTEGVLAWTAVVIVLSVLFEKLVLWLLGLLFAWEPACRRPRLQKDGSDEIGSGRSNGNRQRRGTVVKAAESGESEPETAQDEVPERGESEPGAAQDEVPESGGLESETAQGEVSESGKHQGGRKHQGRGTSIKLTGIAKSYNGQPVLKDFDAVYEEGETYYLTGPSGSGKTTLLHILAGLVSPDAGRVSSMPVCSIAFQEDRLCEDYSAIKNVELVTGDPGRAGEALRLLLEEEALHKPCRQLSGGMRRRVALVRAMEARSGCVLLDEPFTGMDAETRRQAEKYIREKQNGRTILVATHI